MLYYKYLQLIFFLLSPSFFQVDSSYCTRTLYEQEKLNGKVKSIIEIELKLKTDGTKTDSIIKKTNFDSKGSVVFEAYTTISHYGPNVDVFDANTGDKIHKKRLKRFFTYKYNTQYTSEGKITTYSAYGPKEVYLFDRNGILKEHDRYYNNSQLEDKSVYKYDEGNRIIETNIYTEKDSLYGQNTYKYNDKNMLIEKSIFYDENHLKTHLLQTQFIYDYLSFDKFGNWIKRKQKEVESGNHEDKIVTDKVVTRKITYY